MGQIITSTSYVHSADYNQFTRLYTDGSKIGDRLASAVVWQKSCKTARLPFTKQRMHFRAELYASRQVQVSWACVRAIRTLYVREPAGQREIEKLTTD